MSDQPDESLTIDEVATYLKAGKRTVYRRVANSLLSSWGERGASEVANLMMDCQSHRQGDGRL